MRPMSMCFGQSYVVTQIAKFMGPTWRPPGSCRPQMGPILVPWTLLSGKGSYLPNASLLSMSDHIWGTSLYRFQLFHDDVIKWKQFSALLAISAGNSPVTGEIPAQRPVTQSFNVFFDVRLNKRLSKQWWGWWFETPWYPLWRHCNANSIDVTSVWHNVPYNVPSTLSESNKITMFNLYKMHDIYCATVIKYIHI